MSSDPTPTSDSSESGGAGSSASPEPSRAQGQTPNPLRGSRTSGVWIAAFLLAFLLVLLIIFVVQNTQKVHVSFLGWDGQAPLAVALLVAVVAGLVVTGTAGALRILQLRRRVKRDQH